VDAERIVCLVAGSLLLLLVPATRRGSFAFLPSLYLEPGYARVNVLMGIGFPTPESATARLASASMHGALALLLLLSAASEWVLHTLDRAALMILAVVLVVLAAGLLVLQGCLVLYYGARERWRWHRVIPPLERGEDDLTADAAETAGAAIIPRLLPWWAAAALSITLGLAMSAVVTGAVAHVGPARLGQLVLSSVAAAAYVTGALYVLAGVVTGTFKHDRAHTTRRSIAPGAEVTLAWLRLLGYVIAVGTIVPAVGGPRVPEVWDRLAALL
jgi:hypothetical protein